MNPNVRLDDPRAGSKKMYLKPRLHVCGTLEQITRQGTKTHVHGDNPRKTNGKTGG